MSIHWQIEEFDVLPSTMDVARERAEKGVEEGYVVVAKSQTAGRGRRDNVWLSSDGNLYFSFLLRPEGAAKHIGQYSFIAAVTLADVVKPLLNAESVYHHKWPNDGLLNGVKFTGMLFEAALVEYVEIDHLIGGIGVNIASAPEGKAVLNQSTKEPVTRDEFLQQFLSAFSKNLTLYREQGFQPIRDKWLIDAKGLGEDITVRLPKDTLKGVFNGLDEEGALILGMEHEVKKIHAGDVYFGNEI